MMIMKEYSRILQIAIMIAGSSLAVNAQTPYDAAQYATEELNGTSRYVGMGGALSALGGDISTMGTNPAGTGMFRKGEISITASAVISGVGGVLGADKVKASLDQAGLLLPIPTDEDSNVAGVVFGLNIHKTKNFFGNTDTDVNGLNGVFSQTNQIADLANQSLAYDSWGALSSLSVPVYTDDIVDDDHFQYDGIVCTESDPTTHKLLGYSGVGAAAAHYQRATWGSTMAVDMNFSMNVSNQFFFGGSIGVYDVESRRDSKYEELGIDGTYYDFNNYYDTKGSGLDIKLGTIIRPFEDNPFRIGAYIHTPIWYNLKDINGTQVNCYGPTDALLYSDRADYDPYEYRLRTPWKFGLSLGTTVDNYFAVGLDYEYQDLASCKYSVKGGGTSNYFEYQNSMMKEILQGQHTLRVGMEVKPTDEISVRCGYNYVSAPMKDSGYNLLACDGPFTETDYTNWKATNRITFGLGYRYKTGYFDLTYQYSSQKGDFYAFDDISLTPTEIKNNHSQIMATLGFRF